MRSFTTLAVGLGIAAVASASDVVSLTKDTFTDFVKTNELVLAEFYAPWCGHCKALAPHYEEAATTLKEKQIKLAKVDCTEEKALCESFGVEGYPTLKVFRGPDNYSAYTGARKAPAIVSYMTKQSLPAVSTLTKDTLEDFKTADKVVLVAYFAADDKASNATFTTVAEKLRDSFLFGAITDAAVAKAEGVTFPAVILYKSFDEGKSIFTDTFDAETIEKFANTASVPLVGELGPDTYTMYMETGLPLAYIFAETEEERTTLAKSLKDVAELHRSKVNFATIDAKAFGAHAGNLNLEPGKFPAFAIQDTVKNLKYPYSQEKEITAETIGEFVANFVAGRMQPSIKSEPVPETQDGPVTIVVADNYGSIVMDDLKDVLIEYYAPWCGHCKALAPKYDILGQLYIDANLTDRVTIAKVDATANDVPAEITGFPTIMLYKSGDKQNPVTYDGPRSVEDLIKFIKDEGKYGVEVAYEEEVVQPPAEPMPEQAATATESEDTEAAKTKPSDAKKSPEPAEEAHDEL
ncbi:protein disulfide isomerase [Drepanopeziza brunnea f. sp. 'multigermtubi' MB_m1]|uniref:Protein disulfide-isomerase n=1 Tax=Marssonina brunnea f. sp. multigermtubi (strain MB_m1) TaxID=1072389 RepID=K1X203_MARBU|nr:protein disulfide isomerase [Drepanopeziza brunnea f. sp. 'multigermtubi' MB_m1]EKD19226.1 protein disulfide isomerase [Drepanopeziza brunnea f. sp. 'multigermtubi' MB_m1]